MRKLTFILAFVVLALFTQCKKQEPTGTTEQSGIQMVLKANNGSRTSFGPDGAISWSANDKIYVVANGQCVGYVSNGTEGGNTFTGTLTGIIADGTYDFHYYYVGNTQTIANDATSFMMDFSNQDGTLDNLGDFHVGYGVQNGVEVTTGTPITAQTSMKSVVSMAYFDLAGMAETGEKVYFYGEHINNQMTIDFSTNAPTYDKVNSGQICAGAVAAGAASPCYVMLLPNHSDGTEELPTDITFISKRTTGTCNGVFNYGIVGGRFYCNGGNTESPISVTAASYDPGTLRGVFSIDENKTMHFSQGNLQYNKTTSIWSFMEQQYDVVETDWQDVGANYANQNIVSLFGWGTSGWNNGNIYYQPYDTDYLSDWNASDFGFGYGPTDGTSYEYGLAGTYANADWGVYNAIANGGNTPNLWRTLTNGEWGYVFSRTTPSGIRYAKGIVNGVNGIILLPDDWNSTVYTLNYTNRSDAPYYTNEIPLADWGTMEANGAVFLPAAGYRQGTSVNGLGTYGYYGYYWSASYISSDAWYVIFDESGLGISYGMMGRSMGYSVRLVRDVQ